MVPQALTIVELRLVKCGRYAVLQSISTLSFLPKRLL